MLNDQTTTGPRSPMIRGFSLVELVAVFAVAAVLAAVAIPSLTSVGTARAAAAARLALRDLTQARERAIATGVPTWIAFDLAAQSYTVSAEDPDAPGRASASFLTNPTSGKPLTRTLNTAEFANVQITAVNFDANAVLGFDWLGRALSITESPLVAQGTLTFTGGHTVTIEPGTGLVALTGP